MGTILPLSKLSCLLPGAVGPPERPEVRGGGSGADNWALGLGISALVGGGMWQPQAS